MGGKSGPCTHCGITATPLWRRGPPEKPILCNACGSRWRHRGTLAGYMPMQVTGLSTCHVPTDYVAPDEPVIPRVKSAGSLKRKERGEGDSQEEEKGMGDRLRDRKEKDGYETDSSEASLLGQAARRRMSPSCSPISVLPAPRKRASPPRVSHAWGQMSSLFSDLHNFDLDLSDVLTSAQPFGGLDNDVSLYGAEKAPQKPKSLDAGQYISGLVVRTRVDALGGPGCRNSVKQTLTHAGKPSVLKDGQEAKERGMVPPLPSSARFTLPSRPTPPQPPAYPSWANAAPGLAQLNIAKLQGSDFGNGSPHRASFPENLLFKGASPRVPEAGESLNDFMARTRGEKRLGELAGAHDMQGSYDSLDSGASLVLDETREHPTMDLNPPPGGGEKGDKDLSELQRMFSAPIWDSLDADPHAPGGLDKGFGFSVPENGATPLV